jgi:hypothetical protein
MPTRKGAPARAPREHLESCYGPTCARSMVCTQHGKEYTSDQVRELVLNAVAWLEARGWFHPDTTDLHNYGPRLQQFVRTDIQRAIDELVREQDLTSAMITPPHCRHSRLCYSKTNLHCWDESGGAR